MNKSAIQEEIKALKKKQRALERTLAEARMRELLAERHFYALCKQEGLDVEEEMKRIPLRPDANRKNGREGT